MCAWSAAHTMTPSSWRRSGGRTPGPTQTSSEVTCEAVQRNFLDTCSWHMSQPTSSSSSGPHVSVLGRLLWISQSTLAMTCMAHMQSGAPEACVLARLPKFGLQSHMSRKLGVRATQKKCLLPQIAPTGMIFIPCRGGWSHRPDEYASPGDIELGVKALALTLARLAGAASDPVKAEL